MVHRLSDGRAIRNINSIEGRHAEGRRFTQAMIFGLHKEGIFNPKEENIMTLRDLDDALTARGCDLSTTMSNPTLAWRAREFGF